jgi:hypothetical protein
MVSEDLICCEAHHIPCANMRNRSQKRRVSFPFGSGRKMEPLFPISRHRPPFVTPFRATRHRTISYEMKSSLLISPLPSIDA